jgi:hypothetical protein
MSKRNKFYGSLALLMSISILVGCGVARQSGTSAQTDFVDASISDLAVPTVSGQQYPAVLTEVLGAVELKSASSNLFTPASAGDALLVGSQVQTGEDGYARIDLSTGTFIRISPNSLYTMEVNEGSDGSLLTSLKLGLGRVFIVLNGGSLDVTTGQGVASVRGSYMMVMIEPSTENVIVTCLEGQCGAENPEDSVEFTNGQKVILYAVGDDGKYEKIKVGAMDLADFNLWIGDVPEAYEMVTLIAKEVGIGVGQLDQGNSGDGPAANCDNSKSLGCDSHQDNRKDNNGGGKGNDSGGGGKGNGGGKP